MSEYTGYIFYVVEQNWHNSNLESTPHRDKPYWNTKILHLLQNTSSSKSIKSKWSLYGF